MHYRTLWLSDLHLGTRDAKAEALLAFLKRHSADRYYLVGDIIDGWALKRSWHWPEAHTRVVRRFLDIAAEAEVIYVPGNHDEVARPYAGLSFGGITIRPQCVHTTVEGRRFLVVHGDDFDGVLRHAPWVSHAGDVAYKSLLRLNRQLNRARAMIGMPYWSLAGYLKRRAKRAVQFIADFERLLAERAVEAGVDGIICGHIHVAAMREIHGVHYINVGDWVESCTALTEDTEGVLELLQWLPGPHASSESERLLALAPPDVVKAGTEAIQERAAA